MKCCRTASLNGARRTVTLAGRYPASSGKLVRPNRGMPPSADVMFQTAVRWLISSIATDTISRCQRAVASASLALKSSPMSDFRLKAA